MEVLLNGDAFAIKKDFSITQLVKKLELEGKFAIELNQHIIPRSEYPNTILNAGDTIEIVQAIGGG